MLYRDITDTSESSYLFTLPDVLPVSMSKLSVDDPPPATSKGLGGGFQGVTQLPLLLCCDYLNSFLRAQSGRAWTGKEPLCFGVTWGLITGKQ